MEAVAIVTCLLLIEYFYFSGQVGRARAQHGVSAPATDGPDEFMRRYRVHQNTMEQLVVVLPAMWIFANYVHALAAAGLGMVFFVGRLMYSSAYVEDPPKRGPGFLVGFAAMAILVLGALGGAIATYF